MSYGYFRLGSNVRGKVLPPILNPMLVAPVEAEISDVRPTPVPLAEFEPSAAATTREEAKTKGYTGDQCDNCGSMQMRIAGHCMVCESCGTTTGCS